MSSVSPTRPSCSWPRSSPTTARSRSRPRRPASAGPSTRARRVVNLSFGAVRDPKSPSLDSYSKVEAQAVAYAVKKGAVVVAAVGNSDEAYTTPWPYASWPAALPHVIGVGALTRSGKVPDFSDQDLRLRRHRRAGGRHLLHLPEGPDGRSAGLQPAGLHRLRDRRLPPPRGHLVRGAAGRRRPRPCSSASTRRSRAARSRGSSSGTPTTSNAANGCDDCPDGRDKYSGWGRLDVTKAVDFLSSGNPLPPSDRLEPNDSPSQARKLWGSRPAVDATLDFWDDPVDVYRVRLDARRAPARAARGAGGRTRRSA